MAQSITLKDFMPILQTLVGGLLTFSGGLAGNTIFQRQQRENEVKSLASAFYGEIQALTNIAERRQYISLISSLIQNDQLRKTSRIQIRVTRNYFQVYESNIGKIGLLPIPLPEKIVDFYTVTMAILEDIDTISEEGRNNSGLDISTDFLIELKTLLEYAGESSREVCDQIRRNGLLKEEVLRKSWFSKKRNRFF